MVSSLGNPNNAQNISTQNIVTTESAFTEDNGDEIDNDAPMNDADDSPVCPDSNQNVFDFEELVEESNHFVPLSPNLEDLRKLHPNTSCSVIDALCMIYAFAIRHNLTWEAIEDLVRLTNRIIGSQEIQPSKYIFKKKMSQFTNYNLIKHFFCHKCDLYLGTIENINRLEDKVCPNCHAEIQSDTKYKKNHFIAMPIKNQLRDVLERNTDYLNFDHRVPVTEICDVHDSLFFQHLRERTGNNSVITITFSTDGAARFNSTKEKSVWPIQFVLNEIDLEHRFKRQNMLCSAISFGKTPNMQIFFKPFIDEINKINAEGGLSSKNGRTQTVHIIPMIFTGDTPARADVLMKTQFNGYNGCSHCSHSGTLVNKQIRYCKRDNGRPRKNEEARANMLEAQIVKDKVNGYKGLSPLVGLDYFDVVWQIGIDKMHNIDLGVTALMFKLFLKSENKHERYILCFFFVCGYGCFNYRFIISVTILGITLKRWIEESNRFNFRNC